MNTDAEIALCGMSIKMFDLIYDIISLIATFELCLTRIILGGSRVWSPDTSDHVIEPLSNTELKIVISGQFPFPAMFSISDCNHVSGVNQN